MKRTILIPTDFSIESLKLFIEAAESVQIGSVNIILLHCAQLSDSIVDLLFFSKKDMIESLVTPVFNDACKIIRSKYASKINSARIEVFTGHTQAAFQNFLEGNRVDEILIPKNYSLQLNKESFDPIPFIRKSTIPITEIHWKQTGNIPEKNQLAELFLI
ncbi:MAG: hypothetical protein JNM57_03985 [Cyclobacteriaceae bacterium]|nr:hypothetical protein [Cyclobacteriaceae bacterium]